MTSLLHIASGGGGSNSSNNGGTIKSAAAAAAAAAKYMDKDTPIETKLLMLRYNPPKLKRIDITSSLMEEWENWRINEFITSLPYNNTVTTVHLSGYKLQNNNILRDDEIELLVQNISLMKSLNELFIFQGGPNTTPTVLNENLLAKYLSKNLKVLMLWQFSLYKSEALAGALRTHPNLERITLNLPCNSMKIKYQLQYGSLDKYAMGLAMTPKLKVLQIRCDNERGYIQHEAIISPEAFSILINSPSIQSLYLENCGLTDDHMDVILEEEKTNGMNTMKQLQLLDLKDNLFTDDVLYTTGRWLQINNRLQQLDISGVMITDGGGRALMDGIVGYNTSLLHLEIEGTKERYKDEFHIDIGHSITDWWKNIQYQLRINRAYNDCVGIDGNLNKMNDIILKNNTNAFVTALSSVIDNLDCIYYFIRKFPNHKIIPALTYQGEHNPIYYGHDFFTNNKNQQKKLHEEKHCSNDNPIDDDDDHTEECTEEHKDEDQCCIAEPNEEQQQKQLETKEEEVKQEQETKEEAEKVDIKAEEKEEEKVDEKVDDKVEAGKVIEENVDKKMIVKTPEEKLEEMLDEKISKKEDDDKEDKNDDDNNNNNSSKKLSYYPSSSIRSIQTKGRNNNEEEEGNTTGIYDC